jgi:hypothetical protein
VCAAHRLALDSVDPAAVSLTPAAVPDFAESCTDAARLNLLVGPFEAPAITAARGRTRLLLGTTVTVCALVTALGVQRRAAAWRTDAAHTAAEVERVTRGVLPPGRALQDELERLRDVSRGAAQAPVLADASLALAGVLAGWPAQAPCVAHSIIVNESGATLSLALHGDPARFLETIDPPPGWTLDEPRLNAAGGTTRVSVRLRCGDGATP